MKRSILKFRKTDHFLHRQWFRGVDDELLEILFKNLPIIPNNNVKTALILTRTHLARLDKKYKFLLPNDKHLVIIYKGYSLITIYLSETNSDFCLLSKLRKYTIILG